MAASAHARHIPVMLEEVLASLAPRDGEVIIDGTFGAGGYTSAILRAADTRVLAIDQDPEARAAGAGLVAEFGGRLTLSAGAFGTLDSCAAEAGITRADGVVLDIGVSSMQLDDPARGFSFMADGPLDMRMDRDGDQLPASEVVMHLQEEQLADIIHYYGEERHARRVARAIVRAREASPITTTLQLAAIVERAVGRAAETGLHPATRTFQALRIWVNSELSELVQGLSAAEHILAPGGRLVVVTFHSLEDRIVKRFLANRSERGGGGGSRHLPPASGPKRDASFRIVNRQPLTPSQREVAANPRARSAKLRWASRTEAPAFALEGSEALGVPVPYARWR